MDLKQMGSCVFATIDGFPESIAEFKLLDSCRQSLLKVASRPSGSRSRTLSTIAVASGQAFSRSDAIDSSFPLCWLFLSCFAASLLLVALRCLPPLQQLQFVTGMKLLVRLLSVCCCFRRLLVVLLELLLKENSVDFLEVRCCLTMQATWISVLTWSSSSQNLQNLNQQKQNKPKDLYFEVCIVTHPRPLLFSICTTHSSLEAHPEYSGL